MKKASWVGAVVLGLVVVGGGAWWFKSSRPGAAPSGKPAGAGMAQTVTVFSARQQDLPVTIEASALVVALNSVELRPQFSTTVRSVAVKEGQFVRKGDLLFTFDDRNEMASLEKARAALLRDRATLADLDRQWLRAQDLRNQNFIAQSAADTVLSQLEAQRALVSSDEAAVRAAEVAVSYASVRAPMAGRMGAITVNPGSLVQPSGDALVTISQVDPVGVSFSIPERQLPVLLESGARQRAGLPLTVTRAAALGSPLLKVDGRLSFIDNTVDTASGTIKLKGELPNASLALWPGQYVTVSMTLNTIKDAVVVPQSALIIRGQERQVYVVDAEGKAELRPVKLRQSVGDWAAVEGLKVDEQVVLEGKQNLRPGTAVTLAKVAAAASSASAGARP